MGKILLGLMPPLSGLVKIYGPEITWAAQVATHEVNEAGGVLGRPLQLIIEDDKSLPDTAVQAAEKLIDHHGCVAIIGNLLSNSRIAVAYRVAEPRQVPYLNFSFYEGSILSRYFFHFAALPNQQIDKMIPYMANRFGKQIFFAGNNYEWPRGSIAAAKESLASCGGEVVGEEYLPIGVAPEEIDALLDQVAKSDADVFVPYFAGADQVMLLTKFYQRGLKERMAVVMGHYDEMMASQLPAEVRDGYFSSNTYFMTIATKENQQYLKRLADLPDVNGIWPKGNGITTNFGEGAYLCVKAFAEAANRAGSIESKKLVEALRTISVSGPQGMVQMSPETHHARVNTYLSRCNAAGEFEIVENFGAIDPVMPARYAHFRIDDITARNEDMYTLARMMRQMTEGICLIRSDDGVIVYANAGLEKMLGYDTTGELLGRQIKKNYAETEEFSSKNAADIDEHLLHKGFWQGEVQQVRRDGTLIWCSVSISSLTHPEHGEVWMAVHQDISYRKEIEEHLEETVQKRTAQLNQALEKAEAATRIKADFLANMSHEIRTPMNSIIGFSEIVLNDSSLSDGVRERLNKVLFSAKGLLRIINDILDFSKIEAGKLEIEEVCFNLPNTIRDSLQTVSLFAQKKGLDLNFKFADGMPSCFRGDPTRLQQVILNLVGNAIKFTKAGSVTVSTNLNDGFIHFEITDTGIGMTQEQIEKIFESFTQADGSTARNYGGTGLGTTISKKIVEAMGGQMWVKSKMGSGSTFHFTIRMPRDDCRKGCTFQAQFEQETVRSPRCFRILLAEDQPLNAELVQINLGEQRHTITWVTDGQQVMDAIIERPDDFDLVLMDVQMPVMDGLEATRQIRAWEAKHGGHITIIALTASALVEDQIKCTQAGMDGFVMKPIELPSLLAEIENRTPQGVGTLNELVSIAPIKRVKVSLEPLQEVADIKAGLGAWLSSEKYAVALIRFAAEYGEGAENLRQLIKADKVAEAKLLAHSLKGLSLGLTEVIRVSTEIDSALKAGDRETTEKTIPSLEGALKKAVEAIGQLKLPEPETVEHKEFDPVVVLGLFTDLLTTLTQDNPDSAEPILKQLSKYIMPEQLASIDQEVANFDFRKAETETKKLAELLGVEIEENHE